MEAGEFPLEKQVTVVLVTELSSLRQEMEGFIRAARNLRPDVKVVIKSGNTRDVRASSPLWQAVRVRLEPGAGGKHSLETSCFCRSSSACLPDGTKGLQLATAYEHHRWVPSRLCLGSSGAQQPFAVGARRKGQHRYPCNDDHAEAVPKRDAVWVWGGNQRH